MKLTNKEKPSMQGYEKIMIRTESPTNGIKMRESLNSAIWPKVFLTGEVEEGHPPMALCAAAFEGWALCHSRNKPPANFGKGMAAIGNKLNVSPTADELTKLAKAKGWLK